MTQTAMKFAKALNDNLGYEVNPIVITAKIAKLFPPVEVSLFESQKAAGKARYEKRLALKGKTRTGRTGRPRTKMTDPDRERLSQTLEEYREATK